MIRLSIARWIASASLAAMFPAINASMTLNARVRTSTSVMPATLAIRASTSGLNFTLLLFPIFDPHTGRGTDQSPTGLIVEPTDLLAGQFVERLLWL